jgi:hypothetical protein
MEPRESRRARILGVTTIALLWAFVAYLAAHYIALLVVGPNRLHATLGDTWYNAIFPMGGFNVLLLLVMLALVWGAPFGLASLSSAGLLHLLWPKGSAYRKRRAAVLVGLSFTAALPFVLFDGWPGPLYAIPFGDDTEFAQGYSASRFWAVRQGMTEEEVVRLLGPPLRRYPARSPGTEERWYWTRSPRNSSYRIRGVVFRNGLVADKQSEFYVD